MHSSLDTRMGERLAAYLDLSTAEAKVTAMNMANLDTPGYRTVGFAFEAEMRSAIRRSDRGQPSRSPQLREVDGLVARPYGNNVSMEREGLQLAEAQLKSKTATALLKMEYQKILDAIHADSK